MTKAIFQSSNAQGALAVIGLSFIGAIALHMWSKKGQQKLHITKDVLRRELMDSTLKLTARRYEDITAAITPQTVVYPGDPSFKTEEIVSIGNDSSFKLDKISMCNHTGTHVDFPAHVIPGGKTSSDYTLEDLIMDGIIIEVPDNSRSITADFVNEVSFAENRCVLFKTSNSTISKQSPFTENYVYIEPDAAKLLLSKKVKAVGIDYISVDGVEDESLPVHQILLSNDVLIVENLELQGIEPGECQVYVIPNKIPDMDGLPARVMISR